MVSVMSNVPTVESVSASEVEVYVILPTRSRSVHRHCAYMIVAVVPDVATVVVPPPLHGWVPGSSETPGPGIGRPSVGRLTSASIKPRVMSTVAATSFALPSSSARGGSVELLQPAAAVSYTHLTLP